MANEAGAGTSDSTTNNAPIPRTPIARLNEREACAEAITFLNSFDDTLSKHDVEGTLRPFEQTVNGPRRNLEDTSSIGANCVVVEVGLIGQIVEPQIVIGLSGIWNTVEPLDPIDKDLYELPPEEARNIPQLPVSLDAVLRELEVDHDFLLEGGVFTRDLIETWVNYKRDNELAPMSLRPHPYEYELYYGV